MASADSVTFLDLLGSELPPSPRLRRTRTFSGFLAERTCDKMVKVRFSLKSMPSAKGVRPGN